MEERPARARTMKILFLDIDGVLNSTRSSIADSAGYLPYPHIGGAPGLPKELKDTDWVAIGMVAKLIKQQNVHIVISSSWRESFTIKQLENMFYLPILGAIDQDPGIRGEQIQRWLNAHPEVTEYAIVDDNSQFLASQADHFVQTDFDEGLTYANIKALRDILDGRSVKQERSKLLIWGEI